MQVCPLYAETQFVAYGQPIAFAAVANELFANEPCARTTEDDLHPLSVTPFHVQKYTAGERNGGCPPALGHLSLSGR